MKPFKTIEDRRELCALQVFIDGLPAKICGAKEDFATVYRIDRPSRQAQFAWKTVSYVCDRGGFFQVD